MPIALMIAFLTGIVVGFTMEFAARWVAWREIAAAQDTALKALKQAKAAHEAAQIILHDVIERVVAPEVLNGVIERVVKPEGSE